MPLLVIEKGHDKGKSIPVLAKGATIIGRDSSTAYPIRDTMASRMHFKIEKKDGSFWLNDLESTNGTYVNGARVRDDHPLNFGDAVKVGETLFTFLSDDGSVTSLSGQRFGGYRIIERVGRGGMGTVYKAEQIDLQRNVALKVISDEHTREKEFVDLFIHEARASAKLNHPNIVQVYDVKRHNEFYYFSMEFVSGGSVQDILNRQRKIPVEEATRMILDSARGLDHAHQKGIIHRDVKPDNLMISETGTVKIGDMGLARGPGEKIGPEEDTSVIGTPHYIAPEQILGKQADFRSDIYSLGASFYRMLAGVTPYAAASVRELVNKKVSEDARALREHNSEVPPALASVVARMMAREPRERYQSMTQVVVALEKIVRGSDADTDVGRSVTGPWKALVGSRTFIAVAAIALAAIVVGVLVARDDAPVVASRDKKADDRMANQMLQAAKLHELRRADMDDPASLSRAIAQYDPIIGAYPGTRFAVEAAERRADLVRRKKELTAADRFSDLESQDVERYESMLATLQGGEVDLSPVLETADAYVAFAAAEENSETDSAREAESRGRHVRAWLGRVEQQRSALATSAESARGSVKEGKFGDALKALVAAEEAMKKAAMNCEFSEDRYASMLFEEEAAREAAEVVSQAMKKWEAAKEDADDLSEQGQYSEAIELVRAASEGSIAKVVTEAGKALSQYEMDESTAIRRERMRKMEEDAARKEKARIVYVEGALEARKLIIAYDFTGALDRFQTVRDADMMDDVHDLLDRRMEELGRLVHLKEAVIGVINAKAEDAYGFIREYETPAGKGKIREAGDDSFDVLLITQGRHTVQWTQLAPPGGLYEFVRTHWTYKREQKLRDLTIQCDVVALCMEFGLYEEALEEIAVMEAARENPQYSVTEKVRRFCEDNRKRIESNTSAEYEEIEAAKRLDRLDRFVEDGKLKEARAELNLIRSRYGETEAVEAAAERLKLHSRVLPSRP